MLHVINKFGSGGTRQGRQVGRRGLYLNDYWAQLLPWDQDKYDKAKYFVSGTAMSSEYGWANYPTAYGRAMNLARRLSDEYDAVLANLDAVITPTVPQPARRHVGPEAGPLEWANANREFGPGIR
jgi:amidase